MRTLQRWVLVIGVLIVLTALLVTAFLPTLDPTCQRVRDQHFAMAREWIFPDYEIEYYVLSCLPHLVIVGLLVGGSCVAVVVERMRQRRRSNQLGTAFDERGNRWPSNVTRNRSPGAFFVAGILHTAASLYLLWLGYFLVGQGYNCINTYATPFPSDLAGNWSLGMETLIILMVLYLVPFAFLRRDALAYLRQFPWLWLFPLIVLAECLAMQTLSSWDVHIMSLPYQQ